MKKRILVTGSTGFLGSHVRKVLTSKYPEDEIICVSSKDYNLLEPSQVKKMFVETKPNVVIHLAAYSGGIGANRTYPADFFYQNIMFATLVFHEASNFGVDRLIYTMGGCSYPATVTSPISESEMWNGYPQAESAGYSVAKKMGIVASESYGQQYGLNSVVLIPGNMYGEFDNFRESESHVVPGMIKRFYEAKKKGSNKIDMWGTGKPQRDFVYALDVANTLPYFIDNTDVKGYYNISSGTTVSIKELANTIKEMMDYKGELNWDTSKPDGQMIKIFDVKKMQSLGLKCDTSIRIGLKNTIEWFMDKYENDKDGIRL